MTILHVRSLLIALFLLVGLAVAPQAQAVDQNTLPSFYPDGFARVGSLEISPRGVRKGAYIMVGAHRFTLGENVSVSTLSNQFSSKMALKQYDMVGVTVDDDGIVTHIWVLPKGYSRDQL